MRNGKGEREEGKSCRAMGYMECISERDTWHSRYGVFSITLAFGRFTGLVLSW